VGKNSLISWTGDTNNAPRGCSPVSPGCANCFAARTVATRLRHNEGYRGLAVINEQGIAKWTGEVRLDRKKLFEPVGQTKGRRIFLTSQGDPFHEGYSDGDLDLIFGMMLACQVLENVGDHVFQLLTKREERMERYLNADPGELVARWARAATRSVRLRGTEESFEGYVAGITGYPSGSTTVNAKYKPWGYPENVFPLRRVMLGVSCEDQEWADKRLPRLARTPAAARFASFEPLLGRVDARPWLALPEDRKAAGALDWVIPGGESGRRARPSDLDWIRDLVGQCEATRTPVWVKQVGANCTDRGAPYETTQAAGNDPGEWPEELRVQQHWEPGT
jgi:protein gp37